VLTLLNGVLGCVGSVHVSMHSVMITVIATIMLAAMVVIFEQ
jgi:hypothetical protein